MSTALLLIDHGSKIDASNQAFEEIAELVRKIVPQFQVITAHLELLSPTIKEGFEACVATGAKRIVAVPYMLAPGRHATKDVPEQVREAARKYPEIEVEIGDSLGIDQRLAEIVVERAGIISE